MVIAQTSLDNLQGTDWRQGIFISISRQWEKQESDNHRVLHKCAGMTRHASSY